jgi:hypothetical protein
LPRGPERPVLQGQALVYSLKCETAIGIATRLIVYAGFAIIVGDAVVTLWQRGQYLFALIALGAFPATVFLWPWTHAAFGVSLIWVFAATLIAYPISTFVGRLDPI